MRNVDKLALAVDEILREKYLELSEYVGEYSNIIGVFYHQLMIYITNFIIILHEDREHVAELRFPFLNSEYVETPYLINFDSNKFQESFKEQIFYISYNLVATFRKFISSILFIKRKKLLVCLVI